MPLLSDRENEVLAAIRAEGPAGAGPAAVHRRLIGTDLEPGAVSDVDDTVRVLLRLGVVTMNEAHDGVVVLDELDWPLSDAEQSRLVMSVRGWEHLQPREARELLDPLLTQDRADELRALAAKRDAEHARLPSARVARVDALIDFVLNGLEADASEDDLAAGLPWHAAAHGAAALHDLLRARALLR